MTRRRRRFCATAALLTVAALATTPPPSATAATGGTCAPGAFRYKRQPFGWVVVSKTRRMTCARALSVASTSRVTGWPGGPITFGAFRCVKTTVEYDGFDVRCRRGVKRFWAYLGL